MSGLEVFLDGSKINGVLLVEIEILPRSSISPSDCLLVSNIQVNDHGRYRKASYSVLSYVQMILRWLTRLTHLLQKILLLFSFVLNLRRLLTSPGIT